MSYNQQSHDHARTMMGYVRQYGAELDTLKAEVERLRGELAAANAGRSAAADGYRETIREIAAERDAAIARAEKAERRLRDAYTQIQEDPIDTSKVIEDLTNAVRCERAAHAAAMELLERWREKSHPMNFGRSICEDTRACLAKYGKDASK